MAATTDLIGQAQSLFGGVNLTSGLNLILYGLLFVVLVGIVVFFVYRHIMNKRFNKTITFWRRNPYTGLLVADKNIKAMTVRLDSFGNLGYRLKSAYETKTLLPKLRIEAKTNQHYVEYTIDEKIVEFGGILDYDDDRRAMKAKFVDENTELGRSSLHQMNKERYEKTSFWKEHATLLVNIGAMVVIMIFLYLIVNKLINVIGSISSLVDSMKTLQEGQNNILNSLNNILNQHSLAPLK